MKYGSHDTAIVEHFPADPTYAAELLDEIGSIGNPAELSIRLRQMATASEDCAKSDYAVTSRALPC